MLIQANFVKHDLCLVYQGSEEEKETKKKTYDEYMKLMKRDKRRFNLADADQDGKLNKLGITSFNISFSLKLFLKLFPFYHIRVCRFSAPRTSTQNERGRCRRMYWTKIKLLLKKRRKNRENSIVFNLKETIEDMDKNEDGLIDIEGEFCFHFSKKKNLHIYIV
jgi:hypothetical protein